MDFVKQGKEMRRLRMSLGLTQEQVAERAGISYGHYRKLESGNGCPSLDKLLRIADALETTADVILYPGKSQNYSARMRMYYEELQNRPKSVQKAVVTMLETMLNMEE
ncbi:MAG: helix-turn-helix domain-containing protein [Lachnospiraceae bacterium]|nr:helix-turn-helix domain-containing protein [Lachnospiraceae bacterium]